MLKNKKGLVGIIILIIILVILAAIVYFLFAVVDKNCLLECVKWNEIIKP